MPRSRGLTARRLARLARLLAEAGRVLRTVAGAPDYDRYRAHLAATNPAATPLSREAYMDARLRARYDKPGCRCC